MARRRRRKTPRKVQGGIKARSESGEFAKNWWAKRWIQAMENLVDVNRLRRGRYYAREGQVLSLEESRGIIVARVQGSRPKPYRVKISMVTLSDRQWERVLRKMAGQAIFAAKLLVGEMPINIEDAFTAVGVTLFPIRAGDLITECSCPDGVNPCKHIAATHYILGDRIDEDPFLVMRLRGRTQNQILRGLRRHRARHAQQVLPVSNEQEQEEPSNGEEIHEDSNNEEILVEENLENFWQQNANLDNFTVVVSDPEVRLPIFRRLGEPEFSDGVNMEDMLSNVYQSVSQAAVIIAYHGGDEDQHNGNG